MVGIVWRGVHHEPAAPVRHAGFPQGVAGWLGTEPVGRRHGSDPGQARRSDAIHVRSGMGQDVDTRGQPGMTSGDRYALRHRHSHGFVTAVTSPR